MAEAGVPRPWGLRRRVRPPCRLRRRLRHALRSDLGRRMPPRGPPRRSRSFSGRAAIREMERRVLEGAEGWLGQVMSVLPQRPMSVGGSPRHGVYGGADFGWGKPCRVDMVSIEKTPGTVSLAESPDGQGGVEVGVVLPPDAMEAFASCFAELLNNKKRRASD